MRRKNPPSGVAAAASADGSAQRVTCAEPGPSPEWAASPDDSLDSGPDAALRRVCGIVKSRTGHDFSSYKPNTLIRRIERRISLLGADGMNGYLSLLQQRADEADLLAGDILIGVTRFFRDPAAFSLIKTDIFPRIFADRNPKEPVRIWHACCSTGEEVYSMAMLVREYLDESGLDSSVKFFATDLDLDAVNHARAGTYPENIRGDVGEERLQRFFTRVEGGWQVTKQLRDTVVFAHHSLIKDPPFSRLDLLVCRNFLIYLNPDMQRRMFALFHQVLRPGGYLFLGSAESVGSRSDLFAAVDKKWKVYQRLAGPATENTFPLPGSFRDPAGYKTRKSDQGVRSPRAAMEKILVERYAPPSVVVNDRYELVQVSARAKRLLEIPVGEPTRDVLRMVREDLRPTLRSAIYKAFAEQREMVFRGVPVAVGGEVRTITLVAEPIAVPSHSERLVMVIFEPSSPQQPVHVPEGEHRAAGDGEGKEALVRQLEEQLRVTNEQLQAALEQLETSHEGFLSANEELRSINEEYQSANEELQSTNEELETSKEELQAVNEELGTVNCELQVTVEELNRANMDMENLFASSEVATLFLDRELNIKRYTPRLARIFNLIPADLGRPFRHLADTINWTGLAADAEHVLGKAVPLEREVSSVGEGRHYLMRVLPYRAGGVVEGVVVTLVDITERKRMEDALIRAKDHWERTFDSVPDLIAIIDEKHQVVRANRAMADRVGLTPQQWIGGHCHRILHGTDHPPAACPHALTLKDGSEHVVEVYEERLGANFLVTTTPLHDAGGEMIGSVHVARDVTELKRAEEDLRQSKMQVERHLARLQVILDHLNDGVVTADLDGNLFHWNQAAVEMHGFSSIEECRKKLPELVDIFELSTEEGVVPVERWPLARIFGGETLRGWEVRVRRKDMPLERTFSYGGNLARDAQGRPLLAVVSVTDVTERKRVEEMQARLAAVVQSSEDAIFVRNLDGTILTWNDGAERMFGYRADEAIGRPLSILVPPKLELDEMDIQRRILSGERIEHYETVRIAKNGRPIDVSVTASPVKARDGRIVGVSKILRDITERKRGEEALRQSERQFRTLADAIPQLAFMANADGWIFWYNQRWYGYTGTTPQQMEGWGWQSVHEPQMLPSVLKRWKESIATAEPFDMVFPLRGADGTFRPFLTRVLPVRDQDGAVVRWFGTNTDISEQRKREEELQHTNARLNLLAATTTELLKAESPQKIIDSLCERVLEFLDCQAFFNFLVDEKEGKLHLNACAGIPEEEAQRIEWLEYGVAVCGCAARDACRIVANDIPNSGDPRTELVNSYGIKAYACHPLMAQGVILGTLSFGTRTRSSFSDDDLAVMKAVADQVAIAIQRKRMEESILRAHHELEMRIFKRTQELADTVETLLGEISERQRAEAGLSRLNRLYAVLSEIDQALVRASDRDAIFRDFCRIAVEHGGFLLAWVAVVDGEGGGLRTVAACGATGYLDGLHVSLEEGPAGEGPTGISIRTGTYYICNDFQEDPHTRPWHERGRQFGIRASASIAIKEEERVIGALTLYAGEKEFFDPQQVALLRQMGNDISFCLGNLLRESRRRSAEQALQEETLERLRAMEDLREKERMLIQQSRLAALGEMIGNIAHQWRQPLNALGLMVQELPMCYESGDFTSEYLERTVEKVMQVIYHMSQTIDDFRYFFRPDKEKVTFSIGNAVDKVLGIIDGSLKANRIAIDVSKNGDPSVHGYPSEYSQVLLNILLNARDIFAERSTPQPRIEVRLFEESGKSVVTIHDNGGGIPSEVLDKVFDPYFTTKGPDQGTGVGLYMSKVIIEKNMGGRLSARNTQIGAEFRIES